MTPESRILPPADEYDAFSMIQAIVTGATGFVGNALVKRLLKESGHPLVATGRQATVWPAGVRGVRVGELGPETDWSEAFEGEAARAVIHLAARVHVMDEKADDPLGEFRRANVSGTLNLAQQAAASGARRFIFVSSVKVNGEGTAPGLPYTVETRPRPVDPYGISKLEAEEGLRALAGETGMEVVIIRPVLVYGPGVKANFFNLMKWLGSGIPLPLGAIRNKRSLVALDNLVDLIVTCIHHPAAANRTFLVSDGEDLSTPELLRRLGDALGRPARLLPVPPGMLAAAAAMLGKGAVSRRLCGSLQVDIGKTRELLGWSPPVSVDEALAETAQHFLRQRSR